MYWSRRWKVHNCKPCNYIGIAKNAKSGSQSSSSYMKKFKDSVERDPWGRNCCDTSQGMEDYKKYKIIICRVQGTTKYGFVYFNAER